MIILSPCSKAPNVPDQKLSIRAGDIPEIQCSHSQVYSIEGDESSISYGCVLLLFIFSEQESWNLFFVLHRGEICTHFPFFRYLRVLPEKEA